MKIAKCDGIQTFESNSKMELLKVLQNDDDTHE